MMHTIRLRGPWEYRLLASGESELAPAVGKIKMPCDWGAALGADFRGTVLFRRVFHTPTGLDLGEQVWLAFEAVRGAADVTLNAKLVGKVAEDKCPVRYNITPLLADDVNELLVKVHHMGDGPGGLVGDVRLEIED